MHDRTIMTKPPTHTDTDTQTHIHRIRHTKRHCRYRKPPHTDTQTHRHTDTQTHRHTDTQTHRHRHRHSHGQVMIMSGLQNRRAARRYVHKCTRQNKCGEPLHNTRSLIRCTTNTRAASRCSHECTRQNNNGKPLRATTMGSRYEQQKRATR